MAPAVGAWGLGLEDKGSESCRELGLLSQAVDHIPEIYCVLCKLNSACLLIHFMDH